jgi:hypothetical protein
MEVHVSDLTWGQFIYTRGGKSEKTIDAYVETLAIGVQFLPIKIQRVFKYADGNETTDLPAGRHGATIIIDGIHHWFAFKESGIKKIAAVEWKDKSLDYEKNKVALLLESAKCNISHGDRLSPRDKKRIARDIASTDPACPPLARPPRLYDAPKTVIDCFRWRNTVGLDVALEAARDYLKQRDASLAKLMEYAKICKVEKLVMPYLQAMIS